MLDSRFKSGSTKPKKPDLPKDFVPTIRTISVKPLKEYKPSRDREILFELLGRVCVKCGFSDVRALQFDHIFGGGMEEARAFKGHKKDVYRYYVERPELAKERLQTLCANCNWVKRHENKEYSTGKRARVNKHKRQKDQSIMRVMGKYAGA